MQLLVDNKFTCYTEQKFYADSLKGTLPYEPDVLGVMDWLVVAAEVDGNSHNSHRQAMKDYHRDEWFVEPGYKATWWTADGYPRFMSADGKTPYVMFEYGIKTVRFPQGWVVGRKKWTNRELMEFFWYEVDNQ